jgi:hypothetical protein
VLIFAVLSVLAQSPSDAGVDSASVVSIHGALEAQVMAMPSGPAGGGYDGFITVRPVFGMRVGEGFEAELGPVLRFRLIDSPPEQRSGDFGTVLRRRDWDQASDFGQIISSLRIAPDSSPFFIRVGPVVKKTVGLGHLINRYSNQDNPDYHPTSATAVLSVGPLRAEFFDSDLLGARLFAGDLAWDIGRTFSSSADVFDRYVVALELVYDAAIAGQPPDAVSNLTALQQLALLQVDGSLVVVRNQSVRVMALAGVGSRLNRAANVGLVVGLALDANATLGSFSVKLEARKQAGGFRQGLVGPSYELSRFAALGLAAPPIAQETLPDAFSFYGEVRARFSDLVTFDAMTEYLTFGRTELDSTLTVALLKQWLTAHARFTAIGLGVQPRFAVTAGARLRLFRSFYVLASGGTLFVPQGDGTLTRGFTASAGVGIDFER